MNEEPIFYPDLRAADPATNEHLLRGSSSSSSSDTGGYYYATTSPASVSPPSPGVSQYDFTDHSTSSTTSTVLVAVLIALIFLFVVVLVYLLIPLVVQRIQTKIASSQRRIRRRYETIEGWLISKVRFCSTQTNWDLLC